VLIEGAVQAPITTTLVDAVAVQPFASVPVTVYVPEAAVVAAGILGF
jgi:hypothetical protein